MFSHELVLQLINSLLCLAGFSSRRMLIDIVLYPLFRHVGSTQRSMHPEEDEPKQFTSWIAGLETSSSGKEPKEAPERERM
jgi:hypothetical protein